MHSDAHGFRWFRPTSRAEDQAPAVFTTSSTSLASTTQAGVLPGEGETGIAGDHGRCMVPSDLGDVIEIAAWEIATPGV